MGVYMALYGNYKLVLFKIPSGIPASPNGNNCIITPQSSWHSTNRQYKCWSLLLVSDRRVPNLSWKTIFGLSSVLKQFSRAKMATFPGLCHSLVDSNRITPTNNVLWDRFKSKLYWKIKGFPSLFQGWKWNSRKITWLRMQFSNFKTFPVFLAW